jgi:hypothetical protein
LYYHVAHYQGNNDENKLEHIAVPFFSLCVTLRVTSLFDFSLPAAARNGFLLVAVAVSYSHQQMKERSSGDLCWV